MRKILLLILILFLTKNSFSQVFSKIVDTSPSVKIKWQKKLKGDFSFIYKWEYPLGVEKKSDGKAGCGDGGFCPERCYHMLDANGIVLKDSSKIFYELLDTTHIPYSIHCDAACSEYAGTNLIAVGKSSSGIIYAQTATGIATHCSLNLSIQGDSCIAYVYLNRIMDVNPVTYYYQSGKITIDQTEFAKGILKAEFDFVFENKQDPTTPVYWKGRIYSVITNKF